MIEPISPKLEDKVLWDYYINPALENLSVRFCDMVYARSLDLALKQNKTGVIARRNAAMIFRLALPPLSGYQNICNFIACIGYGILLGAIKPDTGTKLLYAAQVALSTVSVGAKTQSKATPTPPPISLHIANSRRVRC